LKSQKDLKKLIKNLFKGDIISLSRLITLVENSEDETLRIMHEIHKHTGRARRIGITGPPGAGKSSLIDLLVEKMRSGDKRVGIIAIDPSSPFTGGAVLGDRIRMQKHSTDPGVFIRSVGSRGSHGGISRSAYRIAALYDAAGYDYIFFETVGVGQTELDVIKIADTVVVVLVPESGDSIQTMKAGLMEIADIFVVNKSDRPGAEEVAKNLSSMVDMSVQRSAWKQPVILTNALTGHGVDGLVDAINRHTEFLKKTGEDREKRGRLRREELIDLLHRMVQAKIDRLFKSKAISGMVKDVEEGKKSPYEVVDKILSRI